jgi:phosphate transport system permease protein
MNSDPKTTGAGSSEPQEATRRSRGYRRQPSNYNVLRAQAEPLVWGTGGALIVALVMIVGLLIFIFVEGMSTFWPRPIQQWTLLGGRVVLGEVLDEEDYKPDSSFLANQSPELKPLLTAAAAEHDGLLKRWLVRGSNSSGNRDDAWHWNAAIEATAIPDGAIVVERTEESRIYGIFEGLKVDDQIISDQDAAWKKYEELHGPALASHEAVKNLEKYELGRVNRAAKQTDLLAKKLGPTDPKVTERRANEAADRREIEAQIAAERKNYAKDFLLLRIYSGQNAEGSLQEVPLREIIRVVAPNRAGLGSKLGTYVARWWEFVSASPRDANMEGGVFPCIWGTVMMTLFMSLLVSPFGVLAALYLREYAQPGPIVSMIRIAINNLAGVPSIVFGAFGLVFFCYWIGKPIDRIFFADETAANVATFGKGGLLWASLTMALLTLPVVIVATEEALAAVPNSMREGSYACGAGKWQTIRRIVLPRALPGIMTGLILAMARGAGEVAPLMLVGVMQTAPELPVDTVPPYVHLERGFMHLSYHIYSVGYSSTNTDAAKPLVMTATLLLIAIITTLNVVAVWLRNQLRRRYQSNQF